MNEAEQTDWRHLLTLAERARMLQDIARVSLAVGVRLFAEHFGVSDGTAAGQKSRVEQLAFIEHALSALVQDVRQIERNPMTEAASTMRLASPPVRARRVRTPALLEAARRGPSLRSLNETITVLSLDTAENSAIKSFLRMLQQDSAAIGQIAEIEGEHGVVERASHYARQLRGLLSMPWWQEVGWDKGDAVLQAHPRREYARVLRTRDAYRREFKFDWSQPWLTLPSRDTWRLYETWCLFTVLDILITLGFAPTGSDFFALKDGRLTITLANDTASRIMLRTPGGKRLSLTYNQTFAEGRNSLSHTMQPDIVIASADCLWVLDAKFKAYAQPGEEGRDINQMHAYRDGIADDSGRRNVLHAWCLYAGQADSPNRPRLTYGRAEDTAVGALCLRPGNDQTLTHLRDLLTNWLPKAGMPRSPQT